MQPATMDQQSDVMRTDGKACRGFTWKELLVCLALVGACGTLLVSTISEAKVQLLAHGVLVWKGKPIDDAAVAFYPVTEAGRLGEPAIGTTASGDGSFEIVTAQAWRASNPTVGQFAVTVRLADAGLMGALSENETDRLKAFAWPRDTPIRVVITECSRQEVRIDLGDWLLRNVSHDMPPDADQMGR